MMLFGCRTTCIASGGRGAPERPANRTPFSRLRCMSTEGYPPYTLTKRTLLIPSLLSDGTGSAGLLPRCLLIRTCAVSCCL